MEKDPSKKALVKEHEKKKIKISYILCECGWPGSADDERLKHPYSKLGPFQFEPTAFDEFKVESKVLWERYMSAGMIKKLEEDGNVIVTGVFDWIFQ